MSSSTQETTSIPGPTAVSVSLVQRPPVAAPPLGRRPEFTAPTDLLALAMARTAR